MDTFEDALSEKIDPHAVTNENLVENAFGYTKSQGQSQLQSLQEYCQNKMRHEVDFQLKLCDLGFCQKVKIKLRDKSYQQIDEQQKSKLEMTDIWEVLLRDRSSKGKVEGDGSSPYEEGSDEQMILKQAFLLTKSVPRRSNRAKWKEDSGYAPDMMNQDQSILDGKLREKDMVFFTDPSGNLKKYIVKKGVVIGRGMMLQK